MNKSNFFSIRQIQLATGVSRAKVLSYLDGDGIELKPKDIETLDEWSKYMGCPTNHIEFLRKNEMFILINVINDYLGFRKYKLWKVIKNKDYAKLSESEVNRLSDFAKTLFCQTCVSCCLYL